MIMDASISDVMAFARVMLGIVLVFGVAPMVVLPYPSGARSRLDAWVANLVRWCAVLIVVMHVLSGLGLYSRVTLLVCIGAIAWFARYRRQFGGFAGLIQRSYAKLDDTSAVKKPSRSAHSRMQLALLASPPILLFAGSYALRARDVFSSYALSPPDAYVHMAWARSFTQGQLWPDGVYPQGMSALLAVVDAVAPFTDLLDVARFTGPLVGTFVVFAIYYTVVRLTRNPGAALLAGGMMGLFGGLPEWREPWERQVGLLPQEFGLAVAFLAVVFAVLAVTERGGGRLLQLGSGGGLAMNGNVLSLSAAGFVAAMAHPLSAAWLGLMVGVAALCATMVSLRWSYLFGAGVATITGVGVGIGVVPLAELLGAKAYLGYGAGDALSDLGSVTDRSLQTAELMEWFGALSWLNHNWLSLAAMGALVVAAVGVIALAVRRSTRTRAAQLLGVTAVGVLAVGLFDLEWISFQIDAFYVVRLSNMIGPTLAVAFGAGLGALGYFLVNRVSELRLALMGVVGLVALGGFAIYIDTPAIAMGAEFEREQIEYDEMTRLTIAMKDEFDRGAYTVVGPTSQRQVLGDHGWSIEQWVFARDIDEVPHDEILPVPTPVTFVFVEMDPFPVREISDSSAVGEYYFTHAKRGRIQVILYEWAEARRAENPDTTIHYEGDNIRVYRIARNPAIQIDADTTLFQDYTWRPGELFNDGPTSPRDVEENTDTSPDGENGIDQAPAS